MYVKKLCVDPVAAKLQVRSDNPNTSDWQPISTR